ncbi:hypothetical protein [Pseudoalteromonas piratica]|nr:hypothetical protein [Pseudoalteromonas piratica]
MGIYSSVAGGNKVKLNDVICQIVTPNAPIAKKLLKQSVGMTFILIAR